MTTATGRAGGQMGSSDGAGKLGRGVSAESLFRNQREGRCLDVGWWAEAQSWGWGWEWD